MKKGAQIGEMALINATASTRTATCIAKTDVALAVLKVEDFKFVMAKYDEFNKKVRRWCGIG
jgi:CRP-like cAMP-binding protein